MACSMDGCNDNDDIANIFSDKYMELYNSVPYDASEMKSIESSVLSRILNSSCSDYIITVTDVMYMSSCTFNLFYANIYFSVHCLLYIFFLAYSIYLIIYNKYNQFYN